MTNIYTDTSATAATAANTINRVVGDDPPPGVVTGAMVIDRPTVSLPALFPAVTVKLNVPAAEGVPDIVPSDERLRPPGRLPDAIDQVIVG